MKLRLLSVKLDIEAEDREEAYLDDLAQTLATGSSAAEHRSEDPRLFHSRRRRPTIARMQ